VARGRVAIAGVAQTDDEDVGGAGAGCTTTSE
jgi:hypothetical protein